MAQSNSDPPKQQPKHLAVVRDNKPLIFPLFLSLPSPVERKGIPKALPTAESELIVLISSLSRLRGPVPRIT